MSEDQPRWPHRPVEVALRRWRDAAAHPVLTVFLVALVVRVTGAVFFSIVGGEVVAVFDDSTYHTLAADMAKGRADRWDAYSQTLFDSTATFTLPLTVLYWLFGAHAIIGALVSALCGATAAALTSRVLIELVDRRIALIGGLVLALLPSHVLWGSFALKDPAVLAVACGLAMVCAVSWTVVHTRPLLLSTILGMALLVGMAHLRSASFVAALWAFVLAMTVGQQGIRYRLLPVLAVVLLGLPIAFGYEPAGVDILTTSQDAVAYRREAGAVGAATSLLSDPEVSLAAPEVSSEAPATDQGHVEEAAAPQPSEVVDVQIGPQDDALSTNLRHLPRGLVVMLVDPLPWASTNTAKLRAAKAETLLWYPILALAAVGLGGSLRRLTLVAFPLVFGGAMLVVYALTEGNFGTAYRHRSELGLTITVLAALGLADLLTRHTSWLDRAAR